MSKNKPRERMNYSAIQETCSLLVSLIKKEKLSEIPQVRLLGF